MCHLPTNAVSYPAAWSPTGKVGSSVGIAVLLSSTWWGMGVETGQDRCAARRAQRRGDEGVLEENSLLRQFVETRGLEVVVAQPESVEPLVVGEDEDDVPRRISGLCRDRPGRDLEAAEDQTGTHQPSDCSPGAGGRGHDQLVGTRSNSSWVQLRTTWIGATGASSWAVSIRKRDPSEVTSYCRSPPAE